MSPFDKTYDEILERFAYTTQDAENDTAKFNKGVNKIKKTVQAAGQFAQNAVNTGVNTVTDLAQDTAQVAQQAVEDPNAIAGDQQKQNRVADAIIDKIPFVGAVRSVLDAATGNDADSKIEKLELALTTLAQKVEQALSSNQ